MKKFTLLFVALLTMSRMAFGQKEAKLVWETTVARLPYYSPMSYGGIGIMATSESGNTALLYPDNSTNLKRIQSSVNVKAFDKDGKPLWGMSDFYKNKDALVYPYSINGKFNVLQFESASRPDTAVLFDKDLNYVRSFKGSIRPTIEGAFYGDWNDNSIIKYDSKGKEQWRYRNRANTPTNIFNSVEAPYTGLYSDENNFSRLVRLDENGREISVSEPFVFNNTIYSVTKNGSWVSGKEGYDNLEFIRFNNQGKKIAIVPMRNIISKEIFEAKNTRITQFGENNILFVYLKNNEVTFTRIDTLGNLKTVGSGCVLSDAKYFDGYGDFRSLENKDLRYSIVLPEQTTGIVRKHKIGVIRFDTPNLSWQKEIENGAYFFRDISDNVNLYRFQPDGTFLEIYSARDFSSVKSCKVFDINGNIKWESDPQYLTYQVKITDKYLYFNDLKNKSNVTKIRYEDGKVLWQKNTFSVNNFYENIKEDNNNDVIFYQDYDFANRKNSFKIISVNPDGVTNWTYNFKQNNISVAHTDFRFHKGKVIISTLELDGDLYKHVLRKISPCEDLNAISITGSTEACPTEKVKLSIPKQEGVAYQWKRDGQDIPNARDAVYDFGESGTYTVVAKDELCQNQVVSNALKINIRPLPTAEIIAPKTTFCDGEKVTIASRTNGAFFQWQKDGKDIPNATSVVYEVSQAGDYRVGVRDDKCPQLGYSNIYTMITKQLPEANITTDIKGVVYEPFTVKMSANLGTGLAYQWMKDDAIIPDENKVTYEAKKSGKYNVTVTYDGCTKLSDALTINILIPLANSEEIGEEEVSVYPNPSKGEFNIILPKTLKSADIQLFDTFGRERSLTYTSEQARADGLEKGVYFLRVQKGERSVTSKIVIE